MPGFCRFLVLCLCFSAFPAHAQDLLTDAQKRKMHLPYVRVTTECVANRAASNPGFTEALLKNYFPQFLQNVLVQECVPEVSAMMRAHDQIYGGGGLNFAKGPYIADLERAIRVRLKVRISAILAEASRMQEARKLEEAAKQAAKREEDKRTIAEVVVVLRTRAFSCVRREAGSMILTNEKAEVVAKAASILCRDEIGALAEAMTRLLYANGETPLLDVNKLARETVSEIVMAEIIKLRGELLKPTPEPNKNLGPTL